MTDGPPPDDLLPQDDYIDGGSSSVLLGTTIEYTYSRGTRYRLDFDDDFTVVFTVVDHDGPEAERPGTPPPLRYRARDIRPGLVLVHWIVKPAAIHVSLLVDLTERRIHVSAMMPPNRWEFFDSGTIVAFSDVREGTAHAEP